MSLVFALVKGNAYGWASGKTIVTLVIAGLLLVAFVVVQQRVTYPLVPFRLFKSRSLTGADAGAVFVGAGIFAMFFFMILWMQVINGWSPIKAGVAFLPMPILIGVSAGTSAQLLSKVGPRPLLTAGPLISGLGMLTLGLRLEPDSSYLGVVFPSLALVAIGMGMAFVSLTSSAVAGVPHEDAGIASALLNAGQQVGGALGLAILTAVSTTRTTHLLESGAGASKAAATKALVDGWSLGFIVAAALLGMAALLMSWLVRVSKEEAAKALKEAGAAA
jgi:hypothetical protein